MEKLSLTFQEIIHKFEQLGKNAYNECDLKKAGITSYTEVPFSIEEFADRFFLFHAKDGYVTIDFCLDEDSSDGVNFGITNVQKMDVKSADKIEHVLELIEKIKSPLQEAVKSQRLRKIFNK